MTDGEYEDDLLREGYEAMAQEDAEIADGLAGGPRIRELEVENERLRQLVAELHKTRPLTQDDAAHILGEHWAMLEAERDEALSQLASWERPGIATAAANTSTRGFGLPATVDELLDWALNLPSDHASWARREVWGGLRDERDEARTNAREFRVALAFAQMLVTELHDRDYWPNEAHALAASLERLELLPERVRDCRLR